MSCASDRGRLLATTVACIGIALGVVTPAISQSLTPEQLEVFSKLPIEQQRALMEQATRSGAVQADAPLATPDTSRPKAPESDNSGLKHFGYDLFRSAPTTFAPATDIPVPSEYVIGPGDTFEVLLVGERGGRYRLVVGRDGVVDFPELGPIAVAGLRFEAARDLLEQRVSEQMIGMRASISMGALRSIQVFVLGEAESPGSYTVSGLSTITNALLVSGGAKTIGSLRNIQLKRAGQVVGRIDLYDLLLNGDTSADQRLQPGDVIFIPPVGTTIAITGEVRRPAVYEVEDGAVASDMLYLSGGLTPQADPRTARLERVDDRRNRTVVDVDLTTPAGRSTRLQTGDTIRIQPIRDSQEGAVTLLGHVYRGGPTQYQPGMRLTDLVGSLDELRPRADLRYVLIRRETGPTRVVSVASADLEAAFASPGTNANLALQARDRVYVFDLATSRDGVIQPIMDELRRQSASHEPLRTVRVGGRVKVPGQYPLEPGMTVSDLIRAGGGLDDSAYRMEADLVRYQIEQGEQRTTRVVPMSLASVLAGDGQSDLPLEPFDFLTIKEIPDWRDLETITVAGEVRFPGTYPIRRGETLGEVVKRAGGLTDLAFIEGAVFTRADLRQREQRQMDILAERLQRDLAALSLQQASAGQEENAKQAMAVGQALLQDVRSTRAAGRLVIDLKKAISARPGSAAAIALRDGDHLHIPKPTQEVMVLGEVQNTASHLFDPSLSRDDYIRRSGGTTRHADEKRTFIVRADGSVAIGSTSGWFGRVGTHEINAGDTIVVPLNPEQLRPLTLWTSVTQILYNIAVAVAAVNSF